MAVSLPAGLDAVNVVGIEKQINDAIEKKWKEEKERGRNVKMTWSTTKEAWSRVNRASNAQPVGTEGMDVRLPGMWFEKLYFLQNGRIYLSNGHEITINDIPNRARVGHVCAICELRTNGFDDEHQGTFRPCTLRELVAREFEALNRVAEEYDPSLCVHCHRFSSDVGSVMAMHLFKEHPEVVMGQISSQPAAASSPAPSPSSGSPSSSSTVAGSDVPSVHPAPPTVAVSAPAYTATATPTAPLGVAVFKQKGGRPKEIPVPGVTYQCDLCPVTSNTKAGLKIHQGRQHK